MAHHLTRRRFIRDGISAVAISYAAPAFLSDLARAQGGVSRNLVVLYLNGGNDALNTVVPYTDNFYYSRRPNIAVPAGQVLQIGSDSNGTPLGLHPRLIGLRDIFNEGRLAIVQRTGYQNSSRSHFQGVDIYGTADPAAPGGIGWLGRYLDTLGAVDPLVAWNATRDTPRALMAQSVGVPAIPDARSYSFASPNTGAEAIAERDAATRMAASVDRSRPQLAFVNSTALGAFSTLDRVASVAAYQPSTSYPNTGLGLALRTVAGAMARSIGTRIFWVSTGGFDTHANEGNAGAGAYANLMATVNDSVHAFYRDLKSQGLLDSTLLMQFSEFGRRVSENGSQGTDHGAAAVMLVLGGSVRGGVYGTAASLDPAAGNPTLENGGADVRHETDFRAVYGKVLDSWLGVDSAAILGGDFKNGPSIL
jgi:uncharacterized protein (DUF1501 family)